MKLRLLVLLCILNYFPLSAASYFISVKGDDANNGKSKHTAWKSHEKILNQNNLIKSGDSIFFERGSHFTGTLKINVSGIYVGVYGVGDKPVFSGSVEVIQWVQYSENIWKADCEACVSDPVNVLLNNNMLTLGRHPNQGYMNLSEISNDQFSFTDANISFADQHWNQAEVVIRSNRWALEKRQVKQFMQNRFMLNTATFYQISNGFGYFIQRHLNTLDQHGEWFFNKETRELFLYLEHDLIAEKHNIEVSFHEHGLHIENVKDVTIEHLIFKNHKVLEGFIKNGHNIRLNAIDFIGSGKNGLAIISCENPIVENCLIADSNNNGVSWHNNSGGVFNCNQILRTGLKEGRGESGDGAYIALRVTSDKDISGSNIFKQNTIDSTGYIGIDFRTGNTIISSNHISNFCLLKDDGAGIYTWENEKHGNIIEDNMISNGIGAGQGTPKPDQLFASGIYIDDRSANISIRNNSVTNCATAGIYLHNAKNIEVRGNILFANGGNVSTKEKGQLYIRLDKYGNYTEDKALGLDVTKNVWTAAHESAYCIYISVDSQKDLMQLGTFNDNRFSACNAKQTIAVGYRENEACMEPKTFALNQWESFTSQEKGSVFTFLNTKTYQIGSLNLIANGEMLENIKKWIVWPAEQSISHDKENGNPSLKVNINAENIEALVYHEGLTMVKNKLYRLSFTARSEESNIMLEFVPLMATSPWHALGDYVCFSLEGKDKIYTYFFRATESSRNARVNFKSAKSFWLSNVSLNEVDEDNDNEDSKVSITP